LSVTGYCNNVHKAGDDVKVVFGAEYKVSFMRKLMFPALIAIHKRQEAYLFKPILNCTLLIANYMFVVNVFALCSE
jgi:hypothetical protein